MCRRSGENAALRKPVQVQGWASEGIRAGCNAGPPPRASLGPALRSPEETQGRKQTPRHRQTDAACWRPAHAAVVLRAVTWAPSKGQEQKARRDPGRPRPRRRRRARALAARGRRETDARATVSFLRHGSPRRPLTRAFGREAPNRTTCSESHSQVAGPGIPFVW